MKEKRAFLQNFKPVISKDVNSYKRMNDFLINWDIECTFQLNQNAFKRNLSIFSLGNVQFSYFINEGALIYDVTSPLDSTSIAIAKNISDKASFGTQKLSTGDILIFDDTIKFNFIYNNSLKYYIISIKNKFLREKNLFTFFSSYLNKKVLDKHLTFSKSLDMFFDKVVQIEELTDTIKIELEDELLALTTQLLEAKIIITPQLTHSEKISFLLKKEMYEHIDGTMSISSLTEKYDINIRTLQQHFKDLFGFTPKQLLLLLKLNLAHQDLKNGKKGEITVSRIASKWGFKHFGRFSSYYTNLFKQSPSSTLESNFENEIKISTSCVIRNDEMT